MTNAAGVMNSPLDHEETVDSEFYNAMESPIILSNDAFQNERSRELFDAIDELKGCGASHDFDLPEVIYALQHRSMKRADWYRS